MSIFLTAGNGLVGSACIHRALSLGFHVKACFRSEEKATKVCNSMGSLAENLDCIIIEDLTVDGVLYEATKDVQHVVHCAIPVPAGGFDVQGIYQAFVEVRRKSREERLTLTKRSRQSG